MNMRQIILVCIFAALIAPAVRGADYTIKAGSTSQSVYLVLKTEAVVDDVQPRMATGIAYNTTGIKAAYLRPGAAAQPITLVSQTATGTYTSGGFAEVSSTNSPGVYRLDVPNNALLTGVPYVDVYVYVIDYQGFQDLSDHIHINLVGYDPTVANLPANVTQWNGTNVLTPDTAGAPKVTIKDGIGTGEIDTSGGNIVLTSAEHRLIQRESGRFQGIGEVDEIDAVSSQTEFTLANGLAYSGQVNGNLCVITKQGSQSQGAAIVTAATTFNITIDRPMPFTIAVGDEVEFYYISPQIADVKAKTAFLPSATAGAAGGLFIAGTNAPVTIAGPGNAVTILSTSNGDGIEIAGNNLGHGIEVAGGTGGGHGIFAKSLAGGSGMKLAGAGADSLEIGTSQGLVNIVASVPQVAALPSATAGAAGGLPTVDANNAVKVQSGVGANQISLSSGNVTLADNSLTRAKFASDSGLQTIRSGTAQAGGTTTITLDASASATTDFYKHGYIYLTGGTGAGQYRLCTGYNGTSKVATITPAWSTNPDATSTFSVLPAGIANLEAWLGTPAATPTVAGVPEVDVTHVLGSPVCD